MSNLSFANFAITLALFAWNRLLRQPLKEERFLGQAKPPAKKAGQDLPTSKEGLDPAKMKAKDS